jgi:hypothetical protein
MKKVVLSLIAVAFLVASCGPSAKELEEKRIADSIVMADSIAMVQVEQQRVADSIATADSIKVADSIAKIKPAKRK